MSQTFKQLWELLTPTERRKFFLVLGMVMLMAALETLGIVFIMPFLAVLGNPDIVNEQPVLRWMFERFGFADTGPIIIALGLASAMFVGASTLFKSVTLHVLNRFANLERHSISSRLLANYLRQPYTFFLGRNSTDLSKSLLSETDLLVASSARDGIWVFRPVMGSRMSRLSRDSRSLRIRGGFKHNLQLSSGREDFTTRTPFPVRVVWAPFGYAVHERAPGAVFAVRSN